MRCITCHDSAYSSQHHNNIITWLWLNRNGIDFLTWFVGMSKCWTWIWHHWLSLLRVLTHSLQSLLILKECPGICLFNLNSHRSGYMYISGQLINLLSCSTARNKVKFVNSLVIIDPNHNQLLPPVCVCLERSLHHQQPGDSFNDVQVDRCFCVQLPFLDR